MVATIGTGVQDGKLFKVMADNKAITAGETNIVSQSMREERNVANNSKRKMSYSSAGPQAADTD